jgi:dolichol kinase
MIEYKGEVLRKAVHVGSIVIPIAVALMSKTLVLMILVGVALALLLFDLLKAHHRPFKSLFLAVFGKMLRGREEEGSMTASTIVVASAALTVFVFRQEIAVAALAYLSVGDSAAALVGRHWGRIGLVGNRTLEGSLAALTSCLLVSFVLLMLNPLMGWSLTPPGLLVGSVIATLAELVDLPLDDNLRIPVLAGIAMELVVPG